ncbi:hypothetical protein TVAG_214890 [Trichomonas vaginalis G3]|uniref:Uncharacterized protein n=1 Tax=Trichomonas vaginalis (strain ATCC PRA-98 / G3) TaxID=412133 RepID=A2DK93_TRIV3|nr:hypothetical protein TVAGG3_0170940 [Trichomonas vaginalis G3]EAY19264.1 hypothetical protein TVAG_214890 [Trichomonas vaginalis G3]KAI5548572.1 hypothetical protein TVAGG3_0170940 [Trichomonas vaginalis G3]|eukprot:XP_001580250.1 hypothetical protein [Trichomonas vaginalis G3]
MCQVNASATFLFPDDCPKQNKIWGSIISMSQDKNPKLIVPKSDICPKCGAFKTPQTGCCPICDPAKFYDKDTTLYSLDYKIKIDNEIHEHLICLVIDLSMPDRLLQDLISAISSQFGYFALENVKFMLIFLCQCPLYIHKRNNTLHVGYEQIFYQDSKYIFEINEFIEILLDIYPIIQTCSRLPMSSQSFHGFLDQIKSENITSLLLFHNFPLIPYPPTPFKVHSIFVASNTPVPTNMIQISLENNLTWNSGSIIHKSLIDYIKMCMMEPFGPLDIKIFVSEGLEIEWLCNEENEKNYQAKKLNFTIKNSCKDTSYALTLNEGSKYSHKKIFTMQIATKSENGIYITNRVWQKAETMEEWVTSLNPIVISSIFARQVAAHRVFYAKKGIFQKTITWKISLFENLKGTTILLKRAISSISKLLSNEPPILPPDLLSLIHFNLITKGYAYNADLVNAVVSCDADYLIPIPPLLIYSNKSPTFTDEDLVAYEWCVTPIPVLVDKSIFDRIRNSVLE